MNQVSTIIAGFRSAMIGMTDWTEALGGLTRALGGRLGHAGVMSPSGEPAFHMFDSITREEEAAFYAAGGHDPHHNPRIGALPRFQPRRAQVDHELIDRDTLLHAPIYRGLFREYDTPHSCMIHIPDAGGDALVAVMFPRSHGVADAPQRRMMEAVAPVLAGAMRTGLVLGTAVERTMIDTAAGLSGPAVLLGAGMRILGASPAAESVLREARYLAVRSGTLRATTLAADAALQARLAAACLGRDDGGASFPLPPSDGLGPPLMANFIAAPPRAPGALSMVRAILTLRTGRVAAAADAALAAAFRLTPAEVAVARLLAEGHSIAAIADLRRSAVATVRNQVKALLAKTDTRRQAELVITISRY